MLVLPAITDRVYPSGKASGSVMYFEGNRGRRIATVYGDTVAEMRRNKWDVANRLKLSYEALWFEKGNLMTDCMRAAMKVLRVLGPQTFSLVVPKSTIRALFKRGIINSDLSINRYRARKDKR